MPHAQKPVSPKQLAANRANAAHSSGPKTPEGKARSAQNSTKHGFTASTFVVVRLEDVGWSIFLRYQAQAERQYRRALEEFERLKSLPNVLPNEPICTPEPQQKSPTYPNPDT